MIVVGTERAFYAADFAGEAAPADAPRRGSCGSFTQLVEVVSAEARRGRKALVVHDETVDQVFLEPGGRPLANFVSWDDRTR
jgi:hypothetical protein